MRARGGTLALWAWLCAGVAATAGCARAHEDQLVDGPATYSYTCCLETDLAPVHPGGVLLLHWIVEAGPPARTGSPVPVTLSASLDGAFEDVASLKSSVVGGAPPPSSRVNGSPVHTTDRTGGAPVTTIAIPADAAPGWYNLRFTVDYSGATLSGESVIRVEPSTAP